MPACETRPIEARDRGRASPCGRRPSCTTDSATMRMRSSRLDKRASTMTWVSSARALIELVEAARPQLVPARWARLRCARSRNEPAPRYRLGARCRSPVPCAAAATAWLPSRSTSRPSSDSGGPASSSTVARVHLVFGEWLRREQRRLDAREHLRTGYEMLSHIGAEAFAERASPRAGGDGRDGPQARRVAATDLLTAQEAHIARLASERHTNQEIGAQLFISPRTVEYHLAKVFTKLGINSRLELPHPCCRTWNPQVASSDDDHRERVRSWH